MVWRGGSGDVGRKGMIKMETNILWFHEAHNATSLTFIVTVELI